MNISLHAKTFEAYWRALWPAPCNPTLQSLGMDFQLKRKSQNVCHQNKWGARFYKVLASKNLAANELFTAAPCIFPIYWNWTLISVRMNMPISWIKDEHRAQQKNDLRKESNCVVHGHSHWNDGSRKVKTYWNTFTIAHYSNIKIWRTTRIVVTRKSSNSSINLST